MLITVLNVASLSQRSGKFSSHSSMIVRNLDIIQFFTKISLKQDLYLNPRATVTFVISLQLNFSESRIFNRASTVQKRNSK